MSVSISVSMSCACLVHVHILSFVHLISNPCGTEGHHNSVRICLLVSPMGCSSMPVTMCVCGSPGDLQCEWPVCVQYSAGIDRGIRSSPDVNQWYLPVGPCPSQTGLHRICMLQLVAFKLVGRS